MEFSLMEVDSKDSKLMVRRTMGWSANERKSVDLSRQGRPLSGGHMSWGLRDQKEVAIDRSGGETPQAESTTKAKTLTREDPWSNRGTERRPMWLSCREQGWGGKVYFSELGEATSYWCYPLRWWKEGCRARLGWEGTTVLCLLWTQLWKGTWLLLHARLTTRVWRYKRERTEQIHRAPHLEVTADEKIQAFYIMKGC